MKLLDHTAKEQIVKDYLKKFSIDTFIETGTYEGIMAHAIAPHVRQIFTIELDEKLLRVEVVIHSSLGPIVRVASDEPVCLR